MGNAIFTTSKTRVRLQSRGVLLQRRCLSRKGQEIKKAFESVGEARYYSVKELLEYSSGRITVPYRGIPLPKGSEGEAGAVVPIRL